MDDATFGKKLFATAKIGIPSADQIFQLASQAVLKENSHDQEYIKRNFSHLISEIQTRAYELYLQKEKAICGSALSNSIQHALGDDAKPDQIYRFLEENFGGIDKFCLSLTQSRRPRAGKTFELCVSTLFETLGYPYSEQIEVDGAHPDYVLPSADWYSQYSGDCMIFTLKRTLRERWRQIVTEGVSGQSFYLGTIDDKLSKAELGRMQDRRVIIVVPVALKKEKYLESLNVISFETFFEHHLDTAVARWLSQGAI